VNPLVTRTFSLHWQSLEDHSCPGQNRPKRRLIKRLVGPNELDFEILMFFLRTCMVPFKEAALYGRLQSDRLVRCSSDWEVFRIHARHDMGRKFGAGMT